MPIGRCIRRDRAVGDIRELIAPDIQVCGRRVRSVFRKTVIDAAREILVVGVVVPGDYAGSRRRVLRPKGTAGVSTVRPGKLAAAPRYSTYSYI